MFLLEGLGRVICDKGGDGLFEGRVRGNVLYFLIGDWLVIVIDLVLIV